MSDTFYIVEIQPQVMLDTSDGYEGLATWKGYLAGPFGTFAEADRAFDECSPVDGQLAIYAIYPTGEHIFLREMP